MSEVHVTINNKSYGIACDEGQEERVKELGSYVNERLKALMASGAGSNEVQNMVLTSIILADEIADLQDYNRRLEEQLTEPNSNNEVQIKEVIKEVPIEGALSNEDVEQVTEMVLEVTERINSLSNKLAKAA